MEGFGEAERKKGTWWRRLIGQREKARTILGREMYPEGLGREVHAFWIDDDRWSDIVSK